MGILRCDLQDLWPRFLQDPPDARRHQVDGGVLFGFLGISAPEASSGQNGASVSRRSLSGGMRAKASFCSWLNLPTIPLTLK